MSAARRNRSDVFGVFWQGRRVLPVGGLVLAFGAITFAAAPGSGHASLTDEAIPKEPTLTSPRVELGAPGVAAPSGSDDASLVRTPTLISPHARSGARQDVVWDNGMNYDSLVTAQDEGIPGEIDSFPADDFMFDVDQQVDDVHWIGGYWNGPPDDGDFDWRIIFWDDFGDGTKPGGVIGTYDFPNAQTNETFIETMYYSYSADLPTPMNFAAGTKYWITIQGLGVRPPQSGWGVHESPILLHQSMFKSDYFGYPDWTDIASVLGYSAMDLCFQLTATPQTQDVVWDNGMNYEVGLSNQDDPVEGLDSMPADDFMFAADQIVTDVHWIDAIDTPGYFDWRIIFWDDFGDGTKPGGVIATYDFPNAQTNETSIDGYYHSYSVDLPTPMSFAAGTKYWITIQGVGGLAGGGACYWAFHETPVLLHEAVFKSNYFGVPDWTDATVIYGVPFDMCFQLTAVSNLKWQQLPDEDGWDVNATYPVVLADDFLCTETGWIKDIHFWGSWRNGVEGQIMGFELSLHEDIPADQSPTGYSMPGEPLWYWYTEDFTIIPLDPPTTQGWYDPASGEVVWNDHQEFFKYNVDIPEDWWFPQEQGTIYWLNITAFPVDPVNTVWGWKSSENHWNDDAVWALHGYFDWMELYEPQAVTDPLIHHFGIILDEGGNLFDWIAGPDWYGEGFYFYPWEDWWNIWFYDHPFDPERYKLAEIYISYWDWFVWEQPMYVDFALNWSTDLWFYEGEPGQPPLPGVPEDLYIGREWMISSTEPNWDGWWGDFTIPWYNPEWISADVRGYNFVMEGEITHSCLPYPQSLDLAFEITGGPPSEPEGACCYGAVLEQCVVTTQNDCEVNLGGVYQGDDIPCGGMEACCLSNGTCIDADALCCVVELNGIPQGPGTQCTGPEACCIQDGSGTCTMVDPLCCDEMNGIPQGAGTVCTQPEACCIQDGSGTCTMVDPLCCDEMGGIPQGPGTVCTQPEACCVGASCLMVDPLCCDELGGVAQGPGTVCTGPEACCFKDGSCANIDPLCCDEMGGTLPGEPACLGDSNGNLMDDACEPEGMKWVQLPDFEPDIGMDVGPFYTDWPMVFADDFLCTETGRITEVRVWGSWLFDTVPDHNDVMFRLSFHADNPVGPMGWSEPLDPPLWIWEFFPGDYFYERYMAGLIEGWYDPWQGIYFPGADTECWQYTFPIPEDYEFIQEEGTIYWLDVQAFPLPPVVYFFGWKTSIFHFNDDAVWAEGDDFAHGPWWELRYPYGHPYVGESIDLAFMLFGEPVLSPPRPDPWEFHERGYCSGDPPGTQCRDNSDCPPPQTCEDYFGGDCQQDSDCWGGNQTAAYCVPEEGGTYPGTCYAPMNRYISIARDPAQVPNTARRISLSTGLAGPWWVGPPTYNAVENMYFASVSPTSVYAGMGPGDWVGGDWPDVIHVKGCEIAPGVHTYLVQAIVFGNDESDENYYSEALDLKVSVRWADVVSSCFYDQCLPPTGAFTEPSIDDVLAEVNAFTGIRNAPLPWMDVDPVFANGEPEGLWTLIGDVLVVVNAFSGAPYPGFGPLGCP